MANGRLVGRYELSATATGPLRRAVDRRRGRDVLIATEEAAGGPAALGGQSHHAMVTSQLEHPHILPILDIGREGLEWYVVMAQVSDRTLADALQGHPDMALDVDQVRRLAVQLADALAYAHTRGVVHGDLNADLVWIVRTRHGAEACLAGFGLAGLRGAILQPEDDVVALGHLLRACLDMIEASSRDTAWVSLAALAQRCAGGKLSMRDVLLEASRARPTDGSLSLEEAATEAHRLLIVGEYAQAWTASEQLVGADPRTLPTRRWGELQLLAAQIAFHQGRLEVAMRRCLVALDGVPVGEVPDLQARTAAWMAMVAIWAGRLAVAEPWLERARGFVELADEPERRVAEAMLHRARGNLLLARGRPRDAVRAFGESLVALDDGDDPWERSIAQFDVAASWVAAGDHARATVDLEAAFDAKARLGDRWGLSQIHHLRGRIALDEDDLVRAEGEGQSALRLADAIGAPAILATSHALLADIAIEHGQLGRAMPHAERATRLAHQALAPRAQVWARLVHGRIQLGLGHLIECRQHVESAVRLAARVGLCHLLVEAYLLGASLARVQGAEEDVEAHLRGADEALRNAPHPVLELALRFALLQGRAAAADDEWDRLAAAVEARGAWRLLRHVSTARMKL